MTFVSSPRGAYFWSWTVLLRCYPLRHDLGQIPDPNLSLSPTGFDAVLEHGQTEGAAGDQQRRAGVGGHFDPCLTDLAPQLFLGDNPPAAGAATETVVAVLGHFGD